MNNYKEVLKTAKDLREEFGKDITLIEALQIAAQIQVSNVLSHALLEGVSKGAQPLEAIAIMLGFSKSGDTSTILSTLQEISRKD